MSTNAGHPLFIFNVSGPHSFLALAVGPVGRPIAEHVREVTCLVRVRTQVFLRHVFRSNFLRNKHHVHCPTVFRCFLDRTIIFLWRRFSISIEYSLIKTTGCIFLFKIRASDLSSHRLWIILRRPNRTFRLLSHFLEK